MQQAYHRNLRSSRELFQSRHEFTAGVSGRTDTPELPRLSSGRELREQSPGPLLPSDRETLSMEEAGLCFLEDTLCAESRGWALTLSHDTGPSSPCSQTCCLLTAWCPSALVPTPAPGPDCCSWSGLPVVPCPWWCRQPLVLSGPAHTWSPLAIACCSAPGLLRTCLVGAGVRAPWSVRAGVTLPSAPARRAGGCAAVGSPSPSCLPLHRSPACAPHTPCSSVQAASSAA